MAFSWRETGRRLDADAQSAREQRQAAADAATQRVAAVQQQYDEIQRKLIQPFITAMRAAGNPGLSRREVPTAQGRWPRMRCWRASSPDRDNLWLDILPDGRWFYYDGGYEKGAGGPGSFYTDSEYHSSTEVHPQFPWLIPDGTLQRIQEWMVLLMRRHRVPLPSD